MGTYTAQNAVDLVSKYVKSIPLTDVSLALCDQTNSIIHLAYPWRWTVKELTAISLVNDQQDYSISTVTDFQRLLRLKLRRTDITPNEVRELKLVEYLSPELSQKGGLETIRRAAIYEYGPKIRLERAVYLPTGVTIQITGEYQFQPTKLTSLGTALLPPDQYFSVFTEGLLWRVYKYADDDRAGSIQVVKNGGIVYTGQMGVFYALLQQMKESEDMASGEPTVFPDEPLGDVGYGGFGLFGVW